MFELFATNPWIDESLETKLLAGVQGAEPPEVPSF